MNPDVLLSLLALDSYNRGYDPNVGGLSESGNLGDAKILVLSDTQNVQADWQAAGFYAIAYDMTGVAGFAAGETVISYRGTNFPANITDPEPVAELANDVLGGWSMFLGFGSASHAIHPRA